MPSISPVPTAPTDKEANAQEPSPAATTSADDAATTTAAFWAGSIDLLPVGLFRLALGALLFLDTLEIFPNVLLYYSDDGLWPRRLVDTAREPYSVFWLVGGAAGAYALYGATLLSLVALALGYRTRVSSVVSFVLLASMHARFPFSLDSSDSVARLCLFFLIFCGSGNRASLDALRAARKGTPLPTHGHALPVRLLQAQIGAVYYATASWKMQGPTWRNGTALHYALSIPHMFSRSWALAIANSSWFIHLGTWGTLAVELAILLSIFSPWRRKPAKAVAIALGVCLHATIAVTMSVGLFTFLMPVTYLALLEPPWAQRLWQWLRRGTASVALTLREDARDKRRGPRLLRLALVAVFVLVQAASSPARAWFPAPLMSFVSRASLWGSWRMFAPNPPRADARLRGEMVFPDGRRADLFDGVAGHFGAARGLKFSRQWKVEEALVGGRRSLLRGFAEWRCRQSPRAPGPADAESYRLELILEEWPISALGDVRPNQQEPEQSRVLLTGECRGKVLLSFDVP